jgi:hypothetical protein
VRGAAFVYENDALVDLLNGGVNLFLSDGHGILLTNRWSV